MADKYKAELNAVLTQAMRNYGKAVRYNAGKWTKEDRALKTAVKRITGQATKSEAQ
jgi:hypothetical protein